MKKAPIQEALEPFNFVMSVITFLQTILYQL